MSRVDVYQGDSREILKVLPDNSVDAVVCDPPYALVSIGQRYGEDGAAPTGHEVYARATAGFMGRRWDTGETAFAVEFWAEVLRVLKPGGHVVAFSATRTYHRLACAIEDAGFEIRDMLAWLYGSGFPKSADIERSVAVYLCDRPGRHYPNNLPKDALPGDHICARCAESEAVDGLGSALKPGLEPVVFARKPLIGSLARNVLAHGVGGLNIDGCRIGDDGGHRFVGLREGADHASVSSYGDGLNGKITEAVKGLGRWPANVLHDGSDEVLGAFPASDGQRGAVSGLEPSTATGDVWNPRQRVASEMRGDSGSAARFFYSAKADTEDRLGSDHPTVKPVDVMAWLVRLVCPPGGVVLDPFAGSGTTGLAAMREGCDAILIEREPDHADDIRRRIAWARGEGSLTRQEILRRKLAKEPALASGAGTPLFGGDPGAPKVLGGGRPGSSAASLRTGSVEGGTDD